MQFTDAFLAYAAVGDSLTRTFYEESDSAWLGLHGYAPELTNAVMTILEENGTFRFHDPQPQPMCAVCNEGSSHV